jgi:hypothetical protein
VDVELEELSFVVVPSGILFPCNIYIARTMYLGINPKCPGPGPGRYRPSVPGIWTTLLSMTLTMFAIGYKGDNISIDFHQSQHMSTSI